MHGRIETLPLESRLLRDNKLGDPHVRDVYAYLPPGYDDGDTRYPTVMLLAGFASTHRSVLGFDPWEPNPVERFDRLVVSGDCPPAILVLPDCMNRWGGSQYVDSPATGAYQSHLAEEVIPEVDRSLRTLPERSGRAVVGKSSGGFGALRLAMDRPDLFAAVASHAGDALFEVSMRPMLTTAAIAVERAGGLTAFAERVLEGGPRSSAEFEGVLVLACAAAYSPEPRSPLPHCVLPFDPVTAEIVPDVWERWLEHDPVRRLPAAAEALGSMELVYLDAGDRDEHGLHFAARVLRDGLRRAGATVHHEEFEGGHRRTGWRYAHSLPALIRVLG
ncbi:MAG: alpha/beta hydrolase [Myxococcota bacterium]